MIIGWLKQLSSGLKQFFKIFQSTKKSCIFVAQNIFTIIIEKEMFSGCQCYRFINYGKKIKRLSMALV